MSWTGSNKYLALFVTVLLMLVVYPALRGPGGSLLMANIVLTAVVFAGVWVAISDRRYRILACVLAIPSVAGTWSNYALSGQPSAPVTVAFHSGAILFDSLLIVIVVRSVYRERVISADAIFGALCGYLLTGIAFGHLYCILNAVVPGSFHAEVWPTDGGGEHLLLTYFSFVTLTTVGYGDVLAVKDTARGVAMVEAVAGQFYIAVLVADMIGKRISQMMAPNDGPSQPD